VSVDPGEAEHNLDDAQPPRRSPGAVRGCLGILCVLLMPLLLALPLEALGVPRPLSTLVPVAAFGFAAVGLWLMWGVPAGAQSARQASPLRPLTRTGQAPVREQPATPANRVGLGAFVALLALAAVGVIMTSLATPQTMGVFGGIIVSGLSGLALVGYGVMVLAGRLPAPGWSWLRLPLGAERASLGLPVILVGLVPVVWALLYAAGNGAWWGAIGLAALVVGAAAATPLAQRWPRGR
jgi:hypothetical protein